MSKSVTGWFLYNPLRQKPISLEPLLPWGAFYYYGPDPAAGVSYGSYKDSKGNAIITKSAHIVYSPVTGEPMEYIDSVEFDYINNQLNSSTADMHCDTQCEHCEAKLLGNFQPSYCYSCGKDITSCLNNKKEKTMNLKERVLAKLEQKKAEEKNLAKASVREKVRAKIKEKIEARKAEAAEEEWVDLDTVIKEATSGEDDSAVEKAIEEKVGEAAEKVADKMEEKVEEKVEEVADEAAEKEEEFMPLDMVLSMVERRIERKKMLAKAEDEKKARIAKIKAKVKAKLQAKAETEKEEEDEKAEGEMGPAEKVEEVVEKAADLAAPPHEPKKAVDPLEKIVPSDVEKAPEAPAELFITEAVKFEPLASVEKLAKASKEDIELTLYGNETENPFWNVTAFGTPVAKIELGKQVSPEEIRNVFCSDDYALDLIEHCATSGLVDTLKKVNADFWANSTANERLEKHYNTIVDKKVSEAKAKLVASFKDDFIGSLRVVTAGMNKNLYPDLGNMAALFYLT